MRSKYTLFQRMGIIVILSLFFIGQMDAVNTHHPVRKSNGEGLPTSLQQKYDMKWYFFNLHVESNTAYIKGDVTLKAEVTASILDTLSLFLHSDYTIDSILVDYQNYPFITQGHERLIPNLNLTQSTIFDVQVFYHGLFDTTGTHPFFRSINNNVMQDYPAFPTTYTLSSPYGAFHWFPVKQDLNDKIDSAWLFFTTSDTNKVASNGVLTNTVPLSNNRVRYEWKTNYPIDFYLLAFAVANYMEYSIKAYVPQTNDSVVIQNFIYNDPAIVNTYRQSFDLAADMITDFSLMLGEYPFAKEKYGHVLVPISGGMEHQTMTFLNTDDIVVIAHELAHQWFGDLVTCSSYEDIWLNEGFANYLPYYLGEKYFGEYAARWGYYDDEIKYILQHGQTGSVHVPAQDTADEARIFNKILTYAKGGSLVQMIRFIINDDTVFNQVLQTYLQQYAYSTASTADFKDVLEQVSGLDFSDFFTQWYYGSGFPLFYITWDVANDTLIFRSLQIGTASDITPFFKTPFEIAIRSNGLFVDTVRFEQTMPDQIFTYPLPTGTEITHFTFDPTYWLCQKPYVSKGTVSIEEYRNADFVRIYPNPATDFLYIKVPEANEIPVSIEVCNAMGQKVILEQTLRQGEPLNVKSLPAGMHFVQIKTEIATTTKRFWKQ